MSSWLIQRYRKSRPRGPNQRLPLWRRPSGSARSTSAGTSAIHRTTPSPSSTSYTLTPTRSDMRPVRLEAEGFTCYRERQQPLDFSSLSLFAIAGPTGAGKSSILDTMLYALFGKVPRIGKQGIAEFISHQRDVMTVALDFRVRGRDYRVTRLTKRQKSGLKSEATLADISGGLERSIADQIQP